MRRILVAWALVAVACGGQVSQAGDGGAAASSASSSGASASGGSSGSAAEGGPVGSSSGVSVPLCPTEPPAPGTTCQAPGQQGCVYETGGDCASFLCEPDGTWHSTTEGC